MTTSPVVPLHERTADIERFDMGLTELLTGTGLRLMPGSICMVPSSAYERWGIKATPDNWLWLEQRARTFYEKAKADNNWKPTEVLPSTILLDTLKQELKSSVISMAREILKTLTGRAVFKVGVFGTEAPSVVAQLATICSGDSPNVAKKSMFFFSEVGSGWHETKDTYGLHCVGPSASDPQTTDMVMLSGMPDRIFDLIISFLHLHQRPFAKYLPGWFKNTLSDGGALVIADIYSALWHDPRNMQVLLGELGADSHLLRRFGEYFGLPEDPSLVAGGLNQMEIAARSEHLEQWVQISRKMPPRRRMYCLAANVTSRQRIDELHQAGFTTNPDDVRMAFPRLNEARLTRPLMPHSDLARVMVAIKR